MALTDYDKKKLSKSDQAKIQAATDKWNSANARGDEAGKKAAAAEAAAVRNNAGYRTDGSGNYAGSYLKLPTAGGYSPYSGGSNADNVKKSIADNVMRDYNFIGPKQPSDNIIRDAIWEKIQSGADAGNSRGWYDDDWRDREPPEYESKYDPHIDELLNQILNRDDFSYDVQSDPLYQQYAKMYQREGDRAMKETLAEAAAGAGGMNSYAITAAQQAANNYSAQLNDRIPQLYQLAYEMYLGDKESKIQDLGILQSADEVQYNRYRDTMSDYRADKNFAYGVYRDDVAQGNWQKTFDNNNYWTNKEFDYNKYWDEKEWEYNQKQNELNLGRYDRETAYKEAWDWINMGITPDAELIERAGMNQAEVNLAVAAVKAEQTKKNSGSKSVKTISKKNQEKQEEDEEKNVIPDDATIANKNGKSWVYVQGKGRISWDELLQFIENGKVKETYNKTTNTVSYTWKN